MEANVKKELSTKTNKINIYQTFLKYNTLIIFALLFIFSIVLCGDTFLTQRNITNVLRQLVPLGIVGISMLLVILTGGIDLSVGSVMAMANVIFAYLLPEHGFWISFGAAIISGLAAGLLAGYVVSYRKLAPFVVTLAIMSIAKGAAFIISDGASIQLASKQYLAFSRGYLFGIPNQVYLVSVIVIIAILVLKYTAYGRILISIGSNKEAVKLSGIKVEKFELSVYAIAAILASIAGILVAGRTGVGTPKIGEGMELDAIAVCVIGGASLNGGRGSAFKTVLGVCILGIIGNVMNLTQVPAYPQQVIKGIIILVAVLLQLKNEK
jgi:ribose transport system permease protein